MKKSELIETLRSLSNDISELLDIKNDYNAALSQYAKEHIIDEPTYLITRGSTHFNVYKSDYRKIANGDYVYIEDEAAKQTDEEYKDKLIICRKGRRTVQKREIVEPKPIEEPMEQNLPFEPRMSNGGTFLTILMFLGGLLFLLIGIVAKMIVFDVLGAVALLFSILFVLFVKKSKKNYKIAMQEYENEVENIHEEYKRALEEYEKQKLAQEENYQEEIRLAEEEYQAELAAAEKEYMGQAALAKNELMNLVEKCKEFTKGEDAVLQEYKTKYQEVSNKIKTTYSDEIVPELFLHTGTVDGYISKITLKQNSEKLSDIVHLLRNGRADTIKEALNLMVADENEKERLKIMQEQKEEARQNAEKQARMLEMQAEEQARMMKAQADEARENAKRQQRLIEKQIEEQHAQAYEAEMRQKEQNRLIERQNKLLEEQLEEQRKQNGGSRY